jgi:hypothetical protein
LSFADVEQEIHLKICEVLYEDRTRPLKYVYTAMWNHARNIRRASRRTDTFSHQAPVVEDFEADDFDGAGTPRAACVAIAPFDLGNRLEDRSCLRRLDARLSLRHKDTLKHVVALSPPGIPRVRGELQRARGEVQEVCADLGISYQGWRNRVASARKAAAAELA